MFKEFFILLLLGHVIGDFYIQTTKMAEKKEKSLKWVFFHCLCYWGVMVLISLPMMTWKMTLAATVAAGFHLLIDWIKFAYKTAKYKKNRMTQTLERNVFFQDLLLHGVTIIGIAYWLAASDTTINEWNICKNLFDVIGMSETRVISWILALLLIHKPANIAIQKLLIIYKPINKDKDYKKDSNAGRLIGTLERIIMLIFISIGQYSAIGLVLTAKSIARYDKISKEKDFAEYYLLGTLISTVIVIVCSCII